MKPHSPADSEACFRELLRTVNLIAVIINTKSEITYCNDYFLQLTGWSLAEVQGRRWTDVFVPPWVEDLSGLLSDLFENRPTAWQHENDVVTRSGERRSVRWNNILLRNADGTTAGAAGIGEDITERRALRREVLDSSARERRHLQSELHDGLGQELFGVAIIARSLATAATRDGLAIAADLDKLSGIASRAIETCRRIARGFSPLSGLQGGLVHALKELTDLPSDWRGPRVVFSGDESAPLRLSPEALDQLYRIAQEGLANALKHAAATSIDIRLDVQPDVVELTIVDDGAGLPASVEANAGIGLKIMRYRANLICGQLRIGPAAGGGTRICIRCEQTP